MTSQLTTADLSKVLQSDVWRPLVLAWSAISKSLPRAVSVSSKITEQVAKRQEFCPRTLRRVLEKAGILVCDIDKRCGHLIFKTVTGYIVNYPLALIRSNDKAQSMERSLAQRTAEMPIVNELVKENVQMRIRVQELEAREEEAKRWAQLWQKRFMHLEKHLEAQELEADRRATQIKHLQRQQQQHQLIDIRQE